MVVSKIHNMMKSFFGRKLSDEGPSNAVKATQVPRRDPSDTSQPRAKDDLEFNNKTTFLTLPVEIRLRIYDLLLVSRFDRDKSPGWAVGRTNQKKICLDTAQAPQYRSMEPAILRTCKMVHNEAVSTLYSKNAFLVTKPETMLRFYDQIRPGYLQLIKSLYLFVPCESEVSPWLNFLSFLASKEHGLRRLDITWDTAIHFLWLGYRPGLGDNMQFVRALGKVRGVDELSIKGYYAIHWPSYLEGEMGMRVKAQCGRDLEIDDAGNLEEELRHFKEYQYGTEDLIP